MKFETKPFVTMELSVVIPTYNRSGLVIQAARSALLLANLSNIEVIIVDDNSSDDTAYALQREFGKQLDEGLVRLISNAENMGATGAKNVGAAVASGEWVIFLDSDDLLRKENVDAMLDELRAAKSVPMVFFRCVDFSTGKLIGRHESSGRSVGLKDILTGWVWGECLPVVKREAFIHFPYDATLRGFEDLSYCRMTQAFGPACLSTVVARTYRTVGHDRLSSRTGLRIRSCELARGHLRMMWEFAGAIGIVGASVRLAKACAYAMRCFRLRMTPRSSERSSTVRKAYISSDE